MSKRNIPATYFLVTEYAHLIPELDAIEAFGFWLKSSRAGWTISKPAVERLETGECYPIFVLYHDGVSVGVYETPTDALAKINDGNLSREYLSLISDSDGDLPSGQSH